ncbi:MAG: hypothetical protein AB1407_13430 [Spirochaetota bacterium]
MIHALLAFLLATSAQAAPARGGAEEAAAFDKHAWKADKPAADQAEASPELDDRPALKYLLKHSQPKAGMKTAGAASEPARDTKNKLVRSPNDFELQYKLDADAEVRITVKAPDGGVMKSFTLAAGEPGGKKGVNKLSVWDGQDAMGEEAPVGDYVVVLAIAYGPDKTEVRELPLRKEAL